MAPHITPFAGAWYPAEPGELDRLLGDVFELSRQRTGPCTLPPAAAYVVPHAGLAYSGTVAAAAYRHLAQEKPKRIILLGFSHRGGPSGVAIPDVARIATPAGEVEIDGVALARLASQPPFHTVPEAHICDHSVEIQLPLLLKAAPGVPVAPLYVGPISAEERRAAAGALAALAAPGTVFIASSDLTHYGRSFGYQPFPPDEEAPHRLQELDEGVIEAAGSVDARFFLDHIAATGSTVCGCQPIALLLETLALSPDEVFQQTLDYQTSGEITGDYQHSVSYAALAYFHAGSLDLGREDQGALLESAHDTLARMLETGKRKPRPPKGGGASLARRAGVFVSLHQGGCLRGCVGHKSGREPLLTAVPQLALSAALDDPRFKPLRAPEGEMEIEISILSPLKRVRAGARFRVGLHGAYIESGAARALLLPQVAADRNWCAETFLEALSLKAGLPPEAWNRPGARLYVFQAQVFARKSGLAAQA